MTRDQLIAALQKCPDNVEVIIYVQSIGVPSTETGEIYSGLKNMIVINLIGEEYAEGTRSDSQ